MQLQCPNCGEKIAAGNINIQDKIAVCSACDTVFKFELPEEKSKRRKIKQPQNLVVRDEETLLMSFRTNFRLDRDEGFVSSASLAAFAIGIGGLMFMSSAAGEVPQILPVAIGLFVVLLVYFMALIAYNHTELEMDDEVIRLSRKPLPSLRKQAQEFQLSGIASFTAEETPMSIKEAYDTPRYHVWAEMQDGTRRIIVGNLIEDYAYFVAQKLDERLHSDDTLDSSKLEDFAQDSDELIDLNELTTKKQSLSNR
jgi:hypothetical protein